MLWPCLWTPAHPPLLNAQLVSLFLFFGPELSAKMDLQASLLVLLVAVLVHLCAPGRAGPVDVVVAAPPLPPPPPPPAHQSLTLASASLPAEGLEFPNTALLPGDLTEQLGVDNFFSLWLVFLDADIFTSGERETPPPSGGLVLGGRPTQWWWLLASSRSASVQTWPLPRSSSSSVAPVVVVVVVVVVVACLDRRCFGLTPTASS